MPEREHPDRRRDERDALIAEVRRLTDDPADRAETRTVREDMDALSPDWPEDPDEAPRER
jgi:hypothetical protein